MKKLTLSMVCFLFLGLVLSCQESQKDEAVAVRPKQTGAARRACSNQISYSFMKPDSYYGYNTNGCVTYYVDKGTTRSFKIKMSNTTLYSGPVGIRIVYPDNAPLLTYSVASYTGGSVSYSTYGSGLSIEWVDTNMPGPTTYELMLNITGASSGSAENGISLYAISPCTADPSSDCDDDENLHVVLH